MHDRLLLLLIGVPVFLALCTWGCLAALAAGKAEDASWERQRDDDMGDPTAVPERDLGWKAGP